MIGLVLPAKRRVEEHRQEQIESVVEDLHLADRAFLRRVVDEILLRAMRPDVTLQCELARDDVFNGDFLVPAVVTVARFAAGFRDLFGAAQRAPDRFRGLPSHRGIISGTTSAIPVVTSSPCAGSPGRTRAR